MVEEFVSRLMEKDAASDKPEPMHLIQLLGTIEYDDSHDYKAARTRGVRAL